MKKYHFYVTQNFCGTWSVVERGKGKNFSVSFPSKYRAQLVQKWLWIHWKKRCPYLELLKSMVSAPVYLNDWKKLKNLMLAYTA